MRLIPYQALPYPALNEDRFAQLVEQAFSMRRKTLRNNLKGFISVEGIEICGIDPSIRAEVLSVSDFVRLADYWHQNS